MISRGPCNGSFNHECFASKGSPFTAAKHARDKDWPADFDEVRHHGLQLQSLWITPTAAVRHGGRVTSPTSAMAYSCKPSKTTLAPPHRILVVDLVVDLLPRRHGRRDGGRAAEPGADRAGLGRHAEECPGGLGDRRAHLEQNRRAGETSSRPYSCK